MASSECPNLPALGSQPALVLGTPPEVPSFFSNWEFSADALAVGDWLNKRGSAGGPGEQVWLPGQGKSLAVAQRC